MKFSIGILWHVLQDYTMLWCANLCMQCYEICMLSYEKLKWSPYWYGMLCFRMKLEKEAPHREEIEKVQCKLLIAKITSNFQCKHLFKKISKNRIEIFCFCLWYIMVWYGMKNENQMVCYAIYMMWYEMQILWF